MTNTYCCVYSVETPDDGQQVCLKHVAFFIEINLRNSASCWLLLQEYITMHGPLNGKNVSTSFNYSNDDHKNNRYYPDDDKKSDRNMLVINNM